MGALLKEIEAVPAPGRLGEGLMVEEAVAGQLQDQALHVLPLMDSATRFAMAQREIGLPAGEPPTRGYAPAMFAELPRLLERALAERGRYPAIDILKSASRAMPACNSGTEQTIVARARATLSVYEDMAELIRLGAYKAGTSAEVDAAIKLYPQLEEFLSQKKEERTTLADGYEALEQIQGAGTVKGKAS